MGTYQNEQVSKYFYILFYYNTETHSLLSSWTGKEVVDGVAALQKISQNHLDSETIASSNSYYIA